MLNSEDGVTSSEMPRCEPVVFVEVPRDAGGDACRLIELQQARPPGQRRVVVVVLLLGIVKVERVVLHDENQPVLVALAKLRLEPGELLLGGAGVLAVPEVAVEAQKETILVYE